MSCWEQISLLIWKRFSWWNNMKVEKAWMNEKEERKAKTNNHIWKKETEIHKEDSGLVICACIIFFCSFFLFFMLDVGYQLLMPGPAIYICIWNVRNLIKSEIFLSFFHSVGHTNQNHFLNAHTKIDVGTRLIE